MLKNLLRGTVSGICSGLVTGCHLFAVQSFSLQALFCIRWCLEYVKVVRGAGTAEIKNPASPYIYIHYILHLLPYFLQFW